MANPALSHGEELRAISVQYALEFNKFNIGKERADADQLLSDAEKIHKFLKEGNNNG